MNYSPEKGGVSEYYIPLMIMYQDKLDHKNHYQNIFGSCVQVLNDPNKTNTQDQIIIKVIHLGVKLNSKGNMWLWI